MSVITHPQYLCMLVIFFAIGFTPTILDWLFPETYSPDTDQELWDATMNDRYAVARHLLEQESYHDRYLYTYLFRYPDTWNDLERMEKLLSPLPDVKLVILKKGTNR